MKQNRSQPFKKNSEMVNNYKKTIKNPSIESEDTIDNNMMNLESSDTPSIINSEDVPIEKKSIYLQIKDWFVKNWVSTILIGSIGLLLAWNIDFKVEIAEINTKLDYINEIVMKLDDSYARKEEMRIEIDNIKSLINANGYKDLHDIKQKVNELENKINSN